MVSPAKGTFHRDGEAAASERLTPGAAIGDVASLRDRISVTAGHGGQIVEWLVEDGDLVSPGHPDSPPPGRCPLMAQPQLPGAPHAAILGIGAYRPSG